MNDDMIRTGFLDNWLTSQIGFDAKLINKAKLKLSLRGTLDSIEPAIKTPANVDAIIIASIENMVDAWVENLTTPTPSGPMIVGAAGKKLRKPTFDIDQVNSEIRRNGGNPKQFPPLLLLFLQWAPSLVEMVSVIVNWLQNRNPVVPPTPA